MSLPSKNTILLGGYSLGGSPWVKVTAKPSIDTNTLEYSLDGSPWWAQPDAALPIEYVNSTLWVNISHFNSIAKASIDTIMGISTT